MDVEILEGKKGKKGGGMRDGRIDEEEKKERY